MQPQDPQDSSLFFQKLPPEIRLEIYSHVFYSTRLSFDRRLTKSTPVSSPNRWTRRVNYASVQLRPAPNSLSLVRVCRRVNVEIGHSWIGQVLFSFGSAQTMLEKLAALEPSMLAKLRHMRTTGRPPTLSLQSDQETRKYEWADMLNVLSGLCLDRLTVLGDYAPTGRVDLETLDKLIKHSDGWKELYFLSHNSAILELHTQYWWPGDAHSAPRLSNFNSALVSRDESTASVSIYRSIHAAEYGLMISKPATREAFSYRGPGPIEEAERNAARNPHEMKKEVLVVARRGRGVDCAVKPLPSDIRDVKVVQRRKKSNVRYEGIEVDTYKHVDDYEWTPFHSHRD